MKRKECRNLFRQYVTAGAVTVRRGPFGEPDIVAIEIGRTPKFFPSDFYFQVNAKDPKKRYTKAQYWAVRRVQEEMRQQFKSEPDPEPNFSVFATGTTTWSINAFKKSGRI